MQVVLILFVIAFGAFRAWQLWRARTEPTPAWFLGWLVPLAALVVLAVECGLIRSLLEAEKLVGACVTPLGLVWLATLALTLWTWWRGQRAVALCCTGLFLALTLDGNAWLGAALMHSLERQVPPSDPTQHFDAVLVLGGGTDVTPQGEPELGDSGDRVLMGWQLYHQGRTPLLIASGRGPVYMDHGRQGLVDQEAAVLWDRLGVPAAAVLQWPEGTTTSAEIMRLAREAPARGWSHIGLVSSAWHLPRALRLCREAHLAVTPLPCDYRGQAVPWSVVWLVPHAKACERINDAAWEYLAALADR